MRIDELRFSENPTVKEYMFNSLAHDWSNSDKLEKRIGAIDNYDINLKRDGNSQLIQIFDRKNKTAAGYINLRRSGRSFSILETAVEDAYSGLNLPTKVYTYLIIKLNYTLWADDAQTKGGKSIWEKLAKIKGVHVFAWDRKKKQAISLDPTDIFSDVEIYDTDIEDENSKYEEYYANRQAAMNNLFNYSIKFNKLKSPSQEQKDKLASYRAEHQKASRKLKSLPEYKERKYVISNITLVAQREL